MSSVRLVALEDAHVPDLLRTFADPEVVRFTRIPHPIPEGWLPEWRAKFEGPDQWVWAIELDGDFAGFAVTGPMQREAREVELGYAVSPWARGRGVATATLRWLSEWALAQDMVRLVALISVDNPASSRVAEKAGYTLEGVLRSMHHRDQHRVDLQSWSLLPGELAED